MRTRALSLRLRASAPILAIALAACASVDTAREEPREEVAATASALDVSVFTLPPASSATRAQILAKYASLDPKGLVPRGLLEDAIVFFDLNQAHIPKKEWFVVVDFKPHSGKNRFFMVNLKTGAVEPHKVAHGDGTDPNNDGYADVFGNVEGSHMSSLGYYLTAEIYDGTHAHSMRLDGLSPDGSPNSMANTNVRTRLVVVHEADYVDDANTSQQGRSNGCLALDPSIEVSVVDRIHDGTLVYAALSPSPLHPPVGPGTGGSGGSTGTGGSAGTGSGTAAGAAGAAGKPTGGAGGSPSSGGTSSSGGTTATAGQGGAPTGAAGSDPGAAGSNPGTAGSDPGTAGGPAAGGSSTGGGAVAGGASNAGGSSPAGPQGTNAGAAGANTVLLDGQSSEGSCAMSPGPTRMGASWLLAGVALAACLRRRRVA